MEPVCVIAKLAQILTEIEQICPNAATSADYLREARNMVESAMWEENEAANV